MAKKKAPQPSNPLPFQDEPKPSTLSRFWGGLSNVRKLFIGVLAFLAILATILAVFPEQQRNATLYSVGLLRPSLTPTITPIPTVTPSPTPEFVAAKQDEILVIVSEFENRNAPNLPPSRTMVDQLRTKLQPILEQVNNLSVRIEYTAEIITDKMRARALSDQNNATLVIWGTDDSAGITTNYTISDRWGNSIPTKVEQTNYTAIKTLDEVAIRIRNVTDQDYVTEFTLAQILFSSQQYLAALPLFESALQQVQNESTEEQKRRGAAEGLLYVSYIYGTIQNDVAKEKQILTQVITLNPEFSGAYNNRGVAWYDQGKLDEAIADFNKAISLDPNLPQAYNNRGVVWYDQGKLDEAIADFNKAISLDPNEAAPYANRGSVLNDQMKWDEAVITFNKVIALDPNVAMVYNNRGWARYNQGKLDEAIADFNKAISLDPNHAIVYDNRGLTLSGQGKLDEAIADFNKAISLDPNDATAYGDWGWALYNQKKLDEAITVYRKALVLNPQYSEVYWGLGNVYYTQGRFAEALENYQKYLHLAGNKANESIRKFAIQLEATLTPAPTATP